MALIRRILIGAILGLLILPAASHAQPAPRRVLILRSFEYNAAPDDDFVRMMREGLSAGSPAHIDFFDVTLQPVPTAEAIPDESTFAYLKALLAGHPLDLVVTVSQPAMVFAQKHRARLFASVPVLYTAVDRRWVDPHALRSDEAAATMSVDPRLVVENILQLRPDTTSVYVVVGHSKLEEALVDAFKAGVEPLKKRLNFVLFNNLSFEDMLKQSAALPPHSAILFYALSVDAQGLSIVEQRALPRITAVANAPVFGLYDTQIGRGIVGGPAFAVRDMAGQAASAAIRILDGAAPGTIDLPTQTHGRPTYDWRELGKWKIDEARLPAESVVLFREPSLWSRYRPYLIAIVLVILLQAALITDLVMQGYRRRRTEHALRESEARFRVMANSSPVMIWTAGTDMRTDFFNATLLEFAGLPMGELLGDNWLSRVHPDDVEDCIAVFSPAFADRRPFRMEYRFLRHDDTYRWILDAGVPRYESGGRFVGYIGSAVDITDRKEAEQQNRELAGRLIHAQEAERMRIARDLHDDVSQQLAGLSIMLTNLKRTAERRGTQPDVQAGMSMLQDRITALAKAIRNLSHELHPSVLEHAGLVPTLRRLCADVQQHHQIDVSLTADEEFETLPAEVRLCLFRVAQEALANVVRHAHARNVHVELRTALSGVELSVCDDGKGFVPSVRAREGLGMRSIDERVRLLRGNVLFDSKPGRGMRLIVQIPRSPAAEPRAAISQLT